MSCVFNGGCVYAYIMAIIRKKKVLCSHLVNLFMALYYIHKPLNSHETTRRSGLSPFLSKKGEKRLLSFKTLHPICPSRFPERTGARCHLKEEPTRSGDDVRGDSCCRLLPHVGSTLSALSCPACRQWDDRPLPQDGF